LMTPNDVELLTAYLDQQLSPRDKAAFESRLKHDAELRQTLADLRLNRVALRNLPRLKVPRNFTLSRAQAEAIRKPRRRGLPLLFGALRLATALGALSFMILLGADAMGNVAQPALVANAPAPQQAAEADPSLAREAVTTEGFEAFAVDGQTAPATADDQGGETAPVEEATPDPNGPTRHRSAAGGRLGHRRSRGWDGRRRHRHGRKPGGFRRSNRDRPAARDARGQARRDPWASRQCGGRG
jgi:anti-sigma factor RsiW